MLQLQLRNAFAEVAQILVPSEAGLTILKGIIHRPIYCRIYLYD